MATFVLVDEAPNAAAPYRRGGGLDDRKLGTHNAHGPNCVQADVLQTGTLASVYVHLSYDFLSEIG